MISFAGANSALADGNSILAYALFVSTVVVITATGVTGISMLFNASREFEKEFVENARQNEMTSTSRARAESRRRAARR